MRQAALIGVQEFAINNVSVPEVGDDQALLKVKAVGICGSDLHAYHGKHPFISFPIVPGHEATGVVEKIGRHVHNVKPGDRVVIRPQLVCGTCPRCLSGRYNICDSLKVLGCQSTGACSDYYVVAADLLYALPDSIGFEAGTIIEPLAVGVHAVRRGAADVKGKNVAVIGAGTIGNVVAQSAKGMGANKVMITDVSPFRLDIARKCGLEHAVDTRTTNLAAAANTIFGVQGIDVILECSANAVALAQVLEAAPKGINVVIVGVYGSGTPVNLANVQDREYSLTGTLMYLHEDYKTALEMTRTGKVDLESLITDTFELAEIAKAFAYNDTNRDKAQKVIITVKS